MWACCHRGVPECRGACPFSAFSFALQIEDETQVSRATQGEQDNYEMHVRAANIVSHQVEGTARAPGTLWSPLGFPGWGANHFSGDSAREEGCPWQPRKGLAGSWPWPSCRVLGGA